MVRDGDAIYWMSTKERAYNFMEHKGLRKRSDGLMIHPLSVTFIPGKLAENQILIKKNPNYASKLAGMSKAERDALLDGRWIKATEGKIFKEEWFKHMVVAPAQKDVILVTTDTASSTREGKGSDPDYTVFQVWARSEGKIYLLYQTRGRLSANQSITTLTNVILTYGAKYVSIERAAMGFALIDQIVSRTSVIVVEIVRSGKKGNSRTKSKGTNITTYGNKYERAEAIQAYVEQGYVYLDPKASYYLELIDEIKGFSPSSTDHDDQVDCLVDAVELLIASKKLGYNSNSIKLKTNFKPGYNMV
jgi:predicted phage terminase large subunit-like protein